MDKELGILQSIRRVKAPSDMYAGIKARLVDSNAISSRWIRSITLVFALFVCFEVYLYKASLLDDKNATSMTSAYDVSNNHLYDE